MVCGDNTITGGEWGVRNGTEEDMLVLCKLIKEELGDSSNRGYLFFNVCLTLRLTFVLDLDEDLSEAVSSDFYNAYFNWKRDEKPSTSQKVLFKGKLNYNSC